MASVEQGRIVYLSEAMPDPQGRNPKPNRPFLIITPTALIDPAGFVEIVAISTTFDYPLPDFQIELPYGRGCLTKLSSPSVAVCNWRACISFSLVGSTGGYVKPAVIKQVLERIHSLATDLVRDDRPPAST